MKKLVLIATMAVTAAFIIVSCNKEEQPAKEKELKSEATATVIKVLATKSGKEVTAYVLAAKFGHYFWECNNSCMAWGGVKFHEDCSNYGNVCDRSVAVVSGTGLNVKSSENGTFTFDEMLENSLTMENVFSFPARSFKIVAENADSEKKWINIPEQLLERDPETNTFIFKEVFYSNAPEFENK